MSVYCSEILDLAMAAFGFNSILMTQDLQAYARLGLKVAITEADVRTFVEEQVAEIAGFDHTYPSLLERGLREPGLSAFVRLSVAVARAPARPSDLVSSSAERRITRNSGAVVILSHHCRLQFVATLPIRTPLSTCTERRHQ